MDKILVTSYTNPDLDGCACMYAYAEFLREQGKDAAAGYFGEPQQDARFAFDIFQIPMIDKGENIDFGEVVLVDTNHLNILDGNILPDQVVEIIDHHTDHSEDFPNAKAQIEQIGAAATLVAEKYFQAGMKPSKQASQLLYLAIIGQTSNFRTSHTSQRDKQMAKQLNDIAGVEEGVVGEFFEKLSEVKKPISELLESDLKYDHSINPSFGITVWSTTDPKEFIREYKKEIIEVLKRIRKEKKLQYIWHQSENLRKYETYILVPDQKTADYLETIFGWRFNNLEYKLNELYLRKQMTQRFREYLDLNT